MISPSAEIRTPQDSFIGRKAYREWIATYFRAFPDMHQEIRGIAVEANQTLAFEWRATGTFTTPLTTAGGDIPPNGKTIDISGADFWRLAGGGRRFGELRRLVEGISEKMLIQQLREMEADGIVARKDFREVPPRVEYALTEFGVSVAEALRPLCE